MLVVSIRVVSEYACMTGKLSVNVFLRPVRTINYIESRLMAT